MTLYTHTIYGVTFLLMNINNYEFPLKELSCLVSSNLTLLLQDIYEDINGFYLYVFFIYEKDNYKKIGRITLRLGDSTEIYYKGNIGYNVIKKHRKKGYASDACKIILKYLRQKGIKKVIITVDMKNVASQRVCQAIGGRIISIVTIPYELRTTKSQSKRYIYEINTIQLL